MNVVVFLWKAKKGILSIEKQVLSYGNFRTGLTTPTPPPASNGNRSNEHYFFCPKICGKKVPTYFIKIPPIFLNSSCVYFAY